MTDHPILFNSDMIRALLAGTKTQTRRVLSKTITTFDGGAWPNYVKYPDAFDLNSSWIDPGLGDGGYLKLPWDNLGEYLVARVRPRFEIDDRLWVREIWRPFEGYSNWDLRVRYDADESVNHFEDGDYNGDWNWPKAAKTGNVPSIHMPRWASRITLTVTDVRVEQLQDITNSDAVDEGIQNLDEPSGFRDYMSDDPEARVAMRPSFQSLWASVNGPDAWGQNPWVVATSFKVHLGNIDGGHVNA